MTARAWLDANAVISLVAGPSNSNHDRAINVFRRVADGDLEVIPTVAVVFEVAWFLERRLAWSRARCADQLRSILGARGVVVLDQILQSAVELFATNRRLDFVDAYLGACALILGPATVVSFDRDLDRIDGVARISS